MDMYIYIFIEIISSHCRKNRTKKGVPEIEGPALVCLSAIEKNQCIKWSSSWARILNVQDIIKEKYLRRIFLPPLSPVLATIHSILASDEPGTEDVGLLTKFLFNVGPALRPIAG